MTGRYDFGSNATASYVRVDTPTSTSYTGGIFELSPEVVQQMRREAIRRHFIHGELDSVAQEIKLKESPVKNWKKRIEQG